MIELMHDCGSISSRKRDAGFSLVELMVALTLGVLVAAAISQIYVASRTTFERVENFSDLGQDLPFVFDNFQKDFSRASVTTPMGNSSVDGVKYVELLFSSISSSGVVEPYCGEPAIGRVYFFCSADGQDYNSFGFITVCPASEADDYIDQSNSECDEISPSGEDLFILTDRVKPGTGYLDRSAKYPATWELKFTHVDALGKERPFIFNSTVRSQLLSIVE